MPQGKPLTATEKDEICRRYQAGEYSKDIAADLGISFCTVYYTIKKRGIPPNRYHVPEAEQREICDQYLAGERICALARAFKRSDKTINTVLTHHEIPRRSYVEAQRTYSCNHSFFDSIDTEAKAYWLGFLAADGCVYGNSLHVLVAAKDAQHLLRLKASMSSTHPTRPSGNGGYPAVQFSIRSDQLVAGLAANGITPRKTFTNTWPDFLSADLLRHYLRGYSDGDGSFCTIRPSRVRKSDGERGIALQWNIIGTEAVCKGAQEFLMRECAAGKVKIPESRKSPGIFTLTYGGTRQVSRLWRLLYNDATIYLPRKRDVAAPYVL